MYQLYYRSLLQKRCPCSKRSAKGGGNFGGGHIELLTGSVVRAPGILTGHPQFRPFLVPPCLPHDCRLPCLLPLPNPPPKWTQPFQASGSPSVRRTGNREIVSPPG